MRHAQQSSQQDGNDESDPDVAIHAESIRPAHNTSTAPTNVTNGTPNQPNQLVPLSAASQGGHLATAAGESVCLAGSKEGVEHEASWMDANLTL
jgi:hypothetical protein